MVLFPMHRGGFPLLWPQGRLVGEPLDCEGGKTEGCWSEGLAKGVEQITMSPCETQRPALGCQLLLKAELVDEHPDPEARSYGRKERHLVPLRGVGDSGEAIVNGLSPPGSEER